MTDVQIAGLLCMVGALSFIAGHGVGYVRALNARRRDAERARTGGPRYVRTPK